jgi:hypothetical protein
MLFSTNSFLLNGLGTLEVRLIPFSFLSIHITPGTSLLAPHNSYLPPFSIHTSHLTPTSPAALWSAVAILVAAFRTSSRPPNSHIAPHSSHLTPHIFQPQVSQLTCSALVYRCRFLLPAASRTSPSPLISKRQELKGLHTKLTLCVCVCVYIYIYIQQPAAA